MLLIYNRILITYVSRCVCLESLPIVMKSKNYFFCFSKGKSCAVDTCFVYLLDLRPCKNKLMVYHIVHVCVALNLKKNLRAYR